MKPIEYSFPRYLAAKKSIDDRSLNSYVWAHLSASLPPSSPENPLRVVEIGAGIGTMIERSLERGLLRDAEYIAIDNQPENLAAIPLRLEKWAITNRFEIFHSTDMVSLKKDQHRVTISIQHSDVLDWIGEEGIPSQTSSRRADLLLAHAVLDLLDVPAILPGLLGQLAPGGLFYFSLNFDGLTLLEPEIDPELDELIPLLYHRTMDARLVDGKPSGDSRTGRHIFTHLKNAGARIMAAGASDWVVYPLQGSYPGDEAYFLHFIIHTIHQALTGSPEMEPTRLQDWIAERHAQVERGELVYIAHQIDVLGRKHG